MLFIMLKIIILFLTHTRLVFMKIIFEPFFFAEIDEAGRFKPHVEHGVVSPFK